MHAFKEKHVPLFYAYMDATGLGRAYDMMPSSEDGRTGSIDERNTFFLSCYMYGYPDYISKLPRYIPKKRLEKERRIKSLSSASLL